MGLKAIYSIRNLLNYQACILFFYAVLFGQFVNISFSLKIEPALVLCKLTDGDNCFFIKAQKDI